MEDKAKDIWSKVSGAVSGLSKTVKILIVTGIVIALGAVAVVLALNSNKKYEALFTELNADDMSAIVSYLNDQGETDYKIEDNNTIMVPADREAQMKAKLIAAGYPQSDTGYSLYLDNISALSTESDRSQLALFDLQNRLAGIIRCYDGVQDAVVTITPGEDRRYVLSQDNMLEASAAVIVTLKDEEQPISQKLAEAIQNTVSHSVKGLVVDQVDIRDSHGNTYDGTQQEDTSDIAKIKLDLEDTWNKRIAEKVMDVLVPMFGDGHVSVAVNATVEMNTSVEESTTYSQPAWAEQNADGKGILGTRIWESELIPGDDADGGVVGADPNADLPEYMEEYTPNGNEDGLKFKSEEKYENNKTTVQQIRVAGYLSDVTVAVTIDGRVPNTTTRQELVGHVARAAGLGPDVQDDKISIISHEFYSEDDNVPANTTPNMPSLIGELPWWVYLALLAGLFLFMMLFTVFILLGRARGRRHVKALEPAVAVGPEEELPEDVVDIAAVQQEEEPAGADIMDVHTERSMELRRSVRELAESNPEIAAQAIKTLLRGDEDGNG